MSVGRTSLLLAPLALVARGVAFFVPVVFAGWYGVSGTMDAFYYALNIPTFFLVLGATAGATVIVPGLATVSTHAPERRGLYIGAAAVWSTGATLALALLFAGCLPLVLRGTGFDEPTRTLAWRFFIDLLVFVLLNTFNAVARASCEVQGLYRSSAMAPMVRTIVIIGAALAMLTGGPRWLPFALTLGALTESLYLVALLRRVGVRLQFGWRLPPELATYGRAVLPVLTGETLVALNVVVDKQFAASLPPGTVSILEYADRARMIPTTLLESSLLVVAFNAWALASARADDAGRHRAVATALWWTVLLSPPVLGGMWVGREALVRVLFERGAFSAAHTTSTADVLAAFLPGVLASLLVALAMKAHVVAGRYHTVFWLGAASFLLNLGLNTVFMPRFGAVGLAGSTTITSGIVAGFTLWGLRGELRGRMPTSDWIAAWGVGLASLTAIGATSWLPTPTTVFDPWLWIDAIPFCLLLGVGVWRARRAATSRPVQDLERAGERV